MPLYSDVAVAVAESSFVVIQSSPSVGSRLEHSSAGQGISALRAWAKLCAGSQT
jgi:hypothetical protein